MKLSRISRVVKLLTTLQSGQAYSADQLAELVDVSRRTVFRDLKELAAIGIPYQYDNQAGGYRMDPEFFLPPIDLNLQESLSLLFLVYRGSKQLPVPFKNSAMMAGLKVENNLPATIRSYCSARLRNVSVRPVAQVPMNLLDDVFSLLQNAIIKHRKVQMDYHSLCDGKDISVTISPYHLMYNRRAWYVIGRSSLHHSMRTFKLNRIKSLKMLDRCFIDGQNFDPNEYLGRAWSMIPEGKLYTIKLHFAPKVATNVSEVQWHTSQQTAHNADGSVTLEFRVDGLGEITWWILGYGDQVEVLAPAELRKRVGEIALRTAAINKQSAAPPARTPSVLS